MKVHDVVQGSEAWTKLRLGIPTASNFHKIVTPTGKLSTQARNYMFALIAEELLRYPLDSLDNIAWVARGKQLEPQAVEMYEFDRDVATEPVGFITTDDGRIGCTPDRLIRGHKAALELKCPAPNTHICYMVDGFGTDYIPQAQGQMYVGGFEWVDRYSYHPELPPVLHRTYRDDDFIERLDRALAQFCDEKAAVLAKVKARGYFEERERTLYQGPGLEAAFGLPPLDGSATEPPADPAAPVSEKGGRTTVAGEAEPAGEPGDGLRVPLSANPSIAAMDFWARQMRALIDEAPLTPERAEAVRAANEDGLAKLRAGLPDLHAEIEAALAPSHPAEAGERRGDD